MNTRLEFILIDPQTDFCDPRRGSLYVPGAEKDAERLAKLLDRLKDRIADIHVTLDSHHRFDIGHPLFWLDSQGRHPVVDIPAGKFPIVLSEEDLLNGKWTPAFPGMRSWALDYLRKLNTGGRYAPVIWPYHCLIGEPGATMFGPVAEAVASWEISQIAMADKVTKGSNYRTEHYSAVKAEVEDPEDPSTQLNLRLIDTLREADIIAISGQALSHCVANTVRDIADQFGEENIRKLVLLEDTSSHVPGFESLGENFVREMTARGMQTARSTDFMV